MLRVARGFWPVPLPQARSRVSVRSASAVPGCRGSVMMPGAEMPRLGSAYARALRVRTILRTCLALSEMFPWHALFERHEDGPGREGR